MSSIFTLCNMLLPPTQTARIVVSPPLPRPLPVPELLHAHPCLLALALLVAEIVLGRDRTMLAPDDRVALPARRACNTPFLDRHAHTYALR